MVEISAGGCAKFSIEDWFPQDLANMCLSKSIAMTAIVMGDVNAVHALVRHHGQLLTSQALDERSLLLRGRVFLWTRATEDVYIDDRAFFSMHLPDAR